MENDIIIEIYKNYYRIKFFDKYYKADSKKELHTIIDYILAIAK